jgi:hypothetical protein
VEFGGELRWLQDCSVGVDDVMCNGVGDKAGARYGAQGQMLHNLMHDTGVNGAPGTGPA